MEVDPNCHYNITYDNITYDNYDNCKKYRRWKVFQHWRQGGFNFGLSGVSKSVGRRTPMVRIDKLTICTRPRKWK